MLADTFAPPRISSRWSATTNAKCPEAPTSDDYTQWRVEQLKAELAQRKLRVGPTNRTKRAYVLLLQASDADVAVAVAQIDAATSDHNNNNISSNTPPHVTTTYQIESIDIQSIAPSHVEKPPSKHVHFSPERIAVVPVPITRPPRVLPTTTGKQQQQQQQQQQHDASTQPENTNKVPASHFAPQTIAIIPDDNQSDDMDFDIDAINNSSNNSNNSRMNGTTPTGDDAATIQDASCTVLTHNNKRHRDQTSNELLGFDADMTAMQQQQHTFMRDTLALKAARIDLETRRLALDSECDARSRELHDVQLALAHEQLKQAQFATNKLRVEWNVEQAMAAARAASSSSSSDVSL